MKITIINKILLCFICSIVPYIRESVKIVYNLVCVDGLFCGKAFILVPLGNHVKYIKPGYFLGWNVNILILELSAIWNITICTNMAFVGII